MMSIDCCPCTGPLVAVLPKKMNTLQESRMAPEMYHLCPFTRYSSPVPSSFGTRSIVLLMLVASEDATAGSVIAKAERISWLSNGSSHLFFCSGVPYFWSTSMLPVSGAEQFIPTFASGYLPSISAIGAYSRTLNPETSGRKKFQSPSSLAVCCRRLKSSRFLTLVLWMQKSSAFFRTSKKRGPSRPTNGNNSSGRSDGAPVAVLGMVML
mmetsp:Transcript_120777/g.225793  ORF Transcript_120777/g.225793 Transcript_120777/m.225793 type:complete len:210 (+) Transcript_120777:952-1581(+)